MKSSLTAPYSILIPTKRRKSELTLVFTILPLILASRYLYLPKYPCYRYSVLKRKNGREIDPRKEMTRKNSGHTWTRDSGRLILSATSSLMNMSGYLVFPKRLSRISSWARVKVVRSRRCFRGFPGNKNKRDQNENVQNFVLNSMNLYGEMCGESEKQRYCPS